MIKMWSAQVKKRTQEQSVIGSGVVSWEDFGRVFGFMDYLSITKGEIAQKMVADSTHIFICETKLEIEQGDRLYVNGDGYEVNFVDRPMYGKQAEIELKPILQQNSSIEQFIYFGISTEADVIESDILGFDNQLMQTKAFATVIEGSVGTLTIAYPKSFGKSSIRLNNKPIMDWNTKEIMVNGILHLVYSKAVTVGTLNIELF